MVAALLAVADTTAHATGKVEPRVMIFVVVVDG
jgi:hypothetical protein